MRSTAMSVNDIFKITQKMEFFVRDPETQKERIYYSRIEDIHDNALSVTAPYAKGFYLPRKYKKQFAARVIADDCTYVFKTMLLQYKEDPIPLWVISSPVEITRVQRRNFVRLDIHLNVTLELADPELNGPTLTTITKNLSAGGMGVLLETPLDIGTKVKISLSLENNNLIETEGEVVRIIPPETEQERYINSIKFTKEDAREIFAKYIFRKQIELHQKEKQLFGNGNRA